MKIFLRFFFLSLLLTPSIFPQGYKLVWSDEFNGTSLDQTKWSNETGNNNGNNNEWEFYTSRTQNCSVANGFLTITALKESYNGFNYTSARINTQNKFSFKYGKIEARIKLPYGQGMWPAFWLLGDNINSVGWPACGETDIMEMIGGQGRENTVYGSAHWGGDYSRSYKLSSGTFADDFHVFDIIWTPSEIVWQVDGISYNTLDITPASLSAFQKKFFIILNLAVGGSWPGYPDNATVFPQTMHVDYVRVYQDTTSFPSSSIIAPQNNSSFPANSNITLTANASTKDGSISKVEFYQGALKIGETFVSPYQMKWNNVQAGNYKITCTAYSSTGLTAASDTVNISVGSNASTSPYGGTPAKIPGTIEAENYDLGGQGNAYNDSDSKNNGGIYRPAEGVDIEACSDAGGGFDVGWTQNNEWLSYTVDAQDSGTYVISARTASTSAGGAFRFEIDGKDVTGLMNAPGTGGWQTWTTVQSKEFPLSAGIHKIKLFINSGNFNINKFEIYPPNARPSINMIYPEGGENFSPDSIVEIKWKSMLVDQVLIGFTTNGGTSWSLVQSGVDARFGVYRWKVPAVSSSNCKIKIVNKDNLSLLDSTRSPFSIGTVNSVDDLSKVPSGFSLDQNFPNPFNPSTIINYSIPESAFVTLKVYNLLGDEVAVLVNRNKQSGNYQVMFNAGKLPSGIYFYRLRASNFSITKKLTLTK